MAVVTASGTDREHLDVGQGINARGGGLGGLRPDATSEREVLPTLLALLDPWRTEEDDVESVSLLPPAA